jgi:hypothetical protein
MAKKRTGTCPANDCSGGSAGRQVHVSTAQAAQLTGRAAEIEGAQPGALRRCNYCGAIYQPGAAMIVYGFLDSSVLNDGWKPKG